MAAFETIAELLPERGQEDELEPELCYFFGWSPVCVRFTTRLEERALETGCVEVALVKVNVKYCVSSILHIEMIQVA